MSNHAVVITGLGKAEILAVPVPALRDEWVSVKVHAVAINPTDWKHIDLFGYKNARVGVDYSGIVEEVGTSVKQRFQKGDRICGWVHGANQLNPELGAFQNHIIAKANLQMRIPDNLGFEQAATLGCGLSTVGLALYQKLQVPLPTHPDAGELRGTPILIYGASTATAALAIQFARISGLHIIAACSPDNFEYVKSLGAEAVFDSHSETCGEEIKKYTKNTLQHVFDCISREGSHSVCAKSMGSKGGIYAVLDPVPENDASKINPKIKIEAVLSYRIFGEDIKLGDQEIIPGDAYASSWGASFFDLARTYLGNGTLRVHKIGINEGGSNLEGVMKGLQAGRDGHIRGKKLVYTID